MTNTEIHEHTCRDCGEGFACDGYDGPNGCDRFEGSCPDCFEQESTHYVPTTDLRPGDLVIWGEDRDVVVGPIEPYSDTVVKVPVDRSYRWHGGTAHTYFFAGVNAVHRIVR